jgi:hypothetical protein
MEKLEIKYFGPIKEVEVVIRDINVFIGTAASGKSLVAKLISIFNVNALRLSPTMEGFHKLLADYNCDFEMRPGTWIRYENNGFHLEVSGQSIQTNYDSKITCDGFNPIYIPAERMFFPTMSQSIFGLLISNISLPKSLVNFGAKFEQARSSLKKYSVGFLPVTYEWDGNNDFVRISDEVRIKLSEASSGLQSVIPLILVMQFNTEEKKGGKNIFVIEEPELNLYPSSQKDLVNYIIRRINQSKDKIIITTHSPYLLTSIDNLIQAKAVADIHGHKDYRVKRIVSSPYWIDFDRVSCYYFDSGKCRSTLDAELGSIGPSNMDDVSNQLSDTFEKLLLLKYPS